MNLSLKAFSKLSLAMLVLVSAAFFVMPAKEEAQAQSNQVRNFCYSSEQNKFLQPLTTGCPSGSTQVSSPTSFGGFCVFRFNGVWLAQTSTDGISLDPVSGKCLDQRKVVIPNATFMSYEAIINSYATTVPPTTPPGGGTTTKPPTNTGGTTTPPTDGCEKGFHKLGPLCIPNSPVGSGDSILGEQTTGGLAARIVRILLYFAGIIAVIMAIIGGYYVMTAGGNEAQATSGRKTLTNAIIGLIIVILSYVIIQAVISFVT